MERMMVIVLVNLSMGVVLSKLSEKFPEQILLCAVVIVLISLVLTASMMPKKEDLKRAVDELKEGEVYYVLFLCTTIETGAKVTALVQGKETKKLKLLLFEKDPPPVFKREGEKIVRHVKWRNSSLCAK